MYSDADLDAAVKAGAISADTATKLREFVSLRRSSPSVDEEHFRMLTGFNDIFISIATSLTLIAVTWLGWESSHVGGMAALVAASWGLAEYFTRRRRMALPSILLLLSFVGGVFALAMTVLQEDFATSAIEIQYRVCVAAALASLAAYGHWRRFMVPITLAAAATAMLTTAVSLLLAWFPQLKSYAPGLILTGGLLVFSWAMWWDMGDRARITRKSDVAFWLHLLAAPLIVHPIFSFLGLSSAPHGDPFAMLDQVADASRAAVGVGVYLILAVVALAIDRRALLVSALAYVLYAIATLFRVAGSITESFALTALVIGSMLLLLSAFWHGARRWIVTLLPPVIRERLPVVHRAA